MATSVEDVVKEELWTLNCEFVALVDMRRVCAIVCVCLLASVCDLQCALVSNCARRARRMAPGPISPKQKTCLYWIQ